MQIRQKLSIFSGHQIKSIKIYFNFIGLSFAWNEILQLQFFKKIDKNLPWKRHPFQVQRGYVSWMLNESRQLDDEWQNGINFEAGTGPAPETRRFQPPSKDWSRWNCARGRDDHHPRPRTYFSEKLHLQGGGQVKNTEIGPRLQLPSTGLNRFLSLSMIFQKWHSIRSNKVVPLFL